MDRAQEDLYARGYRSYPFAPPVFPRWSEYPPIQQHPYQQYPLYPLHPKEKACCCSEIKTTIYLMEQRLASIQQSVDNIVTHLNIQSSGPQPQPEGMSQAGSVQEELEITPIVIPSTSRERKQMIRRMEQELENKRQENRQHEERIARLRQELEELKAKNSK